MKRSSIRYISAMIMIGCESAFRTRCSGLPRPIYASAYRTAWIMRSRPVRPTIMISADIGRSKIVSGSGDITVGNATDLDCSTGSGDISVARVAGNGSRLNSGSGDVSIGEANSSLAAKSGSGDVVVKSLRGGSLQANSGSGDIAVSSTSGSVDLRSASGSLTIGVADNPPTWLDLNSVSGDIRIGLESTAQPEPGQPSHHAAARVPPPETSRSTAPNRR